MLTLILGASADPSRYSHLAQERLMEAGYEIMLVSPKGGEVLEVPVLRDLRQAKAKLEEKGRKVDTVTVYVGPDRLRPMVEDLVALAPRRVILNPGTEDDGVTAALKDAGIDVQEACTLVMLGTGTY